MQRTLTTAEKRLLMETRAWADKMLAQYKPVHNLHSYTLELW